MLFPYTYVKHQMEKMQDFIDFIFDEVWCKAPQRGNYSLDLFAANPELYEVMSAFHYDDSEGAEFFSSHVELIYGLFSRLTSPQIAQFKEWYRGNNDLEKVCANDPAAQLVRYEDIAATHKEISEELAVFFKGLYSQSLLGLAVLRSRIGDIDDHYETFVSINKVRRCPFCGLNRIKGAHHSKREAYDHYLPKAQYPFNSINFRNLAPTCHECNSSYKLRKDPVRNSAGRRKAFNPYGAPGYAVLIRVVITHADIDKLVPRDIRIEFGPAALAEELETWIEVYGIQERYKAILCEENDGKYWLTQVLDEFKLNGKQPSDTLRMLAYQSEHQPYADCNFLRKPFLDACEQIGVFEEITRRTHS